MKATIDHLGRRHRRGFTLLELLVVIGIIAVLSGFLMPAMSSARERANRIQCAANLRSLGQAMYLYANDFRNHLPNGNPRLTVESYDGTNDVLTTFASAYVEHAAVFHCPSDLDPVPRQILTADPTLPNSARGSYDFYSVYWMPEYGPLLHQLHCAPLAWDEQGGAETPSQNQNHGTNGGNVVFVDGHVEWQPRALWERADWPAFATAEYLP